VTSLDDALAGEHAAIFGYGALGAHLTGATLALAQQAEAAHRARRDALLLRLASASPAPPAAELAYALPFPVTDQASALRLAIGIEERTGDVWKATLGGVTGDDRHRALDALIDCALRAVRFRRASGQNPGTVPLP
jgi:hypothetical protein